jgi:hypothetical protein
MVVKVQKDGTAYYQCEVCRFLYADLLWAAKCQEWCRHHPSCNTAIVRHAVKP